VPPAPSRTSAEPMHDLRDGTSALRDTIMLIDMSFYNKKPFKATCLCVTLGLINPEQKHTVCSVTLPRPADLPFLAFSSQHRLIINRAIVKVVEIWTTRHHTI